MRARFCCALLLLSTGAVHAAEPSALELIPQDAAFGLAIRNLAELRKKGDDFVTRTQANLGVRPSVAFDFLKSILNIKAGLNEEAPAAILLANAEKLQRERFDPFSLIVVALPFTDRDRMAANFRFKKGEPAPGKIVKAPGGNLIDGLVATVRGNHFYLGLDEEAVASVLEGKRLGADLPAARRKQLESADIAFLLGTKAWGPVWHDARNQVERYLPPGDPAAGPLREAFDHVRYVAGAFRIDDGLGLSAIAVFDEDKPTRRLLETLRTRNGSTLTGLPEGNVFFAQATRHSGAGNAAVPRALLGCLLKDLIETGPLFAAADRPLYVSVFVEIWKRLEGSRLAVYHTGEHRLGLFSAVAILDAADSKTFLKEMKTLARFGGAQPPDLSPRTGDRDDLAAVEQLLRDLGADDFEVRETATTKLGLIGEPALPHLEKTIQSSTDAEIRHRSRDLRDQIQQSAAERRKELLRTDLPLRIHPSLAYSPRAEKRTGQDVDILSIQLPKKDEVIAEQLKELFGPEWDRLRIAPVGKQVVVLIGSDLKLLDAAVRNLKEGKPGLAGSPLLADFNKQAAAGRKTELHLAVQQALALTTAPGVNPTLPAKPAPAVTSLSVTVDTDRIQADLWLPEAEFKTLAQVRRFP
jgi:hypothetical protein